MQRNASAIENGSHLFLIFGRGWIGQDLSAILQKQNENFIIAQSRMENRESLIKEIQQIQPSHILLAAGAVGRPNVDWCEDHQIETIRSNVIGILNVFDVAQIHGIHVTYYATGCIYHYDDDHPEESKQGFTESDPPNFAGSFYSKTKGMVEELTKSFANVLTLRLRMPLTADMISCPRNLILLPELLPLSIRLSKKKRCGVLNFTNPGCITHSEILELYQQFIDPEHQWEVFSLEEQAKILKAPRSNALLDTTELQSEFPSVLPIKESIIKHVFEPASLQSEAIKQRMRQLGQENRWNKS